MLKIYTHSLGCPKNLVDTEHVLGSLGDFIVVDELEDADVVFINTCAFIQSAVQESVATIVEIATQAGEECFIIVCGCLVGRYGTCELKKKFRKSIFGLKQKILIIGEALLPPLFRNTSASNCLQGNIRLLPMITVSCRFPCRAER